ncbi:MAG: hypothetical protein AB8B81_18440 [Halioglobus sp.]
MSNKWVFPGEASIDDVIEMADELSIFLGEHYVVISHPHKRNLKKIHLQPFYPKLFWVSDDQSFLGESILRIEGSKIGNYSPGAHPPPAENGLVIYSSKSALIRGVFVQEGLRIEISIETQEGKKIDSTKRFRPSTEYPGLSVECVFLVPVSELVSFLGYCSVGEERLLGYYKKYYSYDSDAGIR